MKLKRRIALLLTVALVFLTCAPLACAAEVSVANATELQNAIDNATEATVITLTDSIPTTETNFTVGSGKDITIDLNGKTLSGSTANCVWFSLIDVKGGKLTIKDSVGGGSITFAYTGTAANGFATATNTISVHTGTLILESGKIENTTASISGHLHSTVDVLSGSESAYFYMNGGEVSSSNYIAIRQFANSVTYDNAVEISGGTVTGIVFVQSPNANKNKAELTVTDGEFNTNTRPQVIYISADEGTNPDATAMDINIEGGEFNGKIAVYAAPATGFDNGFISGGTFDEDVSSYVAPSKVSMVAAGGNNGYKVGDLSDAAAKADVGGNDVYYEDVEDAFAANSSIEINPDSLGDGDQITVPPGKQATIGNTIITEGDYSVSLPAGSTTPSVSPVVPAPAPTPTPTPSGRPNPSTGVIF